MSEIQRAIVTILRYDRHLSNEEFNLLIPLVSEERRERISRFCNIYDAQNSLIGDILVREALSEMTGLSHVHFICRTNEYGKPFLTNYSDIHYNTSHTRGIVACAFDALPVGIDIELIKPIDINIAKHFFSEDEIDYIFSASNGDELTRFYQVWTMKESLIKWEGVGLSKDLKSFSVLAVQPDDFPPYYHLAQENSESLCYVCTSKNKKPIITHLELADLLESVSHLLSR